jgi:hypothetical protein
MKLALRRIGAIALALALVVSFGAFGANSAMAQGQTSTNINGVWASSINLQNVGVTAATPTITFYNASGAALTSFTPSAPVAAGGALSLYVPAQVSALPAGQQFSAVVSSTEPFQVSVNTASTNSVSQPWTAFAYEGVSQGGTNLYLPGLYKNYFGFSSEMVIQNAGTGTATLTARFFNTAGTQIATASLGTLAPNASKTFGIASLTTTPALPSGNTAGKFGAVVTSNEGVALVGIANLWRTSPTAGTASYNAFTSGSSTLYVPALYKNYFGFGSALTLQNVSGTTAAGKITYGNGASTNFSLAPNASQEFYQPANGALPSGNSAGVFSAKVTTTSGSVVGIVSLSQISGAVGAFASYTVPGAASAQVNIPNVLSDYFGYFSAVTVQNTGATATNITIKYATGQSRIFNNVPANGTVNIIHLNNTGDVLPDKTTTSAVVSSSNGNPLVAVIQHNSANGVSGYNAAKAVGDFLLAVTGSAK